MIHPIALLAGHHSDTDKTGRGCFMDVAAYLNGDDIITDHSPCVCPVVRYLAVWLNDYMRDGERGALLPFVERAMLTGIGIQLGAHEMAAWLVNENMIRRAGLLLDFVEQRFGDVQTPAPRSAFLLLHNVHNHIALLDRAARPDSADHSDDCGSASECFVLALVDHKAFQTFRAQLIVDALGLLDAMLPPLAETERAHCLEAVAA